MKLVPRQKSGVPVHDDSTEAAASSKRRSLTLPLGYLQHYGIQRKTGDAPAAEASAAHADAGLQSPSQPLDGPTRELMESRFGHQFADVRIHTGEHAAAAATAINAHAYTVGRDIVFGANRFDPVSRDGQRLLAHELTHVVQQGQGQAAPARAQRSAADGAATAAAPTPGQPSSTARLRLLIANIERLHAQATAQDQPAPGDSSASGPTAGAEAADVQRHVDTVGQMLERLREVAAGADEGLKTSVLSALSAQGARQAEAKLESQVRVERREPAGVAASSLSVSQPQDAAELEAERVAESVVSGGPVTVQHQGAAIHRQAGAAAIAWGVTTLEVDAVTAPETGPPGWVIGGIVALVALAAIGAGYVLMASAQPETLSAQEEEAVRRKEAGQPYDKAAYRRAQQKLNKNEKFKGERNKQKQRGSG